MSWWMYVLAGVVGLIGSLVSYHITRCTGHIPGDGMRLVGGVPLPTDPDDH